MTIKVAINGYGRILGDSKINAHLTKYDTAHGRFPGTVDFDAEALIINGDRIKTFSERNPKDLPWGELGVDVVLECTGIFASKEACQAHLDGGAKKVLISAPGKNVDATIVYGVNQDVLTADMTVVSNASCTTNCLAPIAKILNDNVGIVNGMMTTIHAYTNDQRLSDVYHSDLYRARAAAMNMIPTSTGAAAAVGFNVSLVDLTFEAGRDTSAEEINQLITDAVAADPILARALAVNNEPLVSIDFNHDAHTSNFDATQTKVQGKLVKVMSWYDNEWGFSNRMLDNAILLMSAK
ncbi:type I glyceraldehyde-3-phosphate dehydrogenase [Moritella viscosa]